MPTLLGQNFLKEEKIAQKIVREANLISNQNNVLEIGPGKGILTQYLLKTGARVVVVEIDIELVKYLKKKFTREIKQGRLRIIQEDILKINIPRLVKEKFSNYQYKVVANIPYYITSKIIRLFLETRFRPREMIIMMQKEVAERIVAPVGKRSLLSLSVQYYANSQILFFVPPIAFLPVPQVESAVIKINIREEFLNLTNEEYMQAKEKSVKFFQVVRAGFAGKRKTLLNNLTHSLHLNKSKLKEILKSVGLDINIRAQNLEINRWLNLVRKISQINRETKI